MISRSLITRSRLALLSVAFVAPWCDSLAPASQTKAPKPLLIESAKIEGDRLRHVLKYYESNGIKLEKFSRAEGQITGYQVLMPRTEGYRIKLDIWVVPSGCSKDEINDRLLRHSRARTVHSNYVLWWPWAEGRVGEENRKQFDEIKTRIKRLFTEMKIPQRDLPVQACF